MTYEEINTTDTEHSIARYSSLLATLKAIAVIVAMVAMYFAVAVSFAWGFLSLIPLLSAMAYLSGQRRRLKYVLQIQTDWGKPCISKERDFKTIRPLFDYISSDAKSND